MTSEAAEQVRANWTRVRGDVAAAAKACGRDPASVQIVGVSKYVDAETTRHLLDAGCIDLGESRPQVLWKKAEELADCDVAWHMIGHLQTNKLRRTLRHRPLIHSVDSERLLRAIDEEAKKQDLDVDVLLEVNISGEDNKTGLAPEQLRSLLTLDDLSRVHVNGLMAMAGWGTDAAEAESQFHAVAQLRDRLQNESGLALPELSMGMSSDFGSAIAAGATMVRIGSALFEGVRREA